MESKIIIQALSSLGSLMNVLGDNEKWSGFDLGVTESEYEELNFLIQKQKSFNGWFVEEEVRRSLKGISTWLTEENLNQWLSKYRFEQNPKNVAIIMAGNIPLVGFHDLLAVLVSGNNAVCKMSSDDKTLLPALINVLINFNSEFESKITLTTGRLESFDAVIATGSDNSSIYFEQYFGKYPHIFRKNRTSIAILTGDESHEELVELGKDIFYYFGLGCRNVTHLLIKDDFDLDRFFNAIIGYSEVVNNNKYANNYDYNKAVYLLNLHNLLDNNFVLLRESEDLHSPLGMIHFQKYSNTSEIDDYIEEHKDKIQAIVGRDYIPFGKAQEPKIDDYADEVDTMKWLSEL